MHLAYSEKGTPDLFPILFLHAFPLNRHMWRYQLDGLSYEYRIIAPDLPGFGQSPLLKETPTIEAYSKSIINLMDRLEIQKAVFGGCSMGGYILFQIYKEYQDRVAGFIFCDTKAAADTEEARQNRFNMIKDAQENGLRPLMESMGPKLVCPATKETKKELYENLKETILSHPVEGIAHSQEAMANRQDYHEIAKTISVPSLLVFGNEDVFTPPEMGRMLHSCIPNSTLEIINHAGHLSPLEQPAIVNEKILQFLAANLQNKS